MQRVKPAPNAGVSPFQSTLFVSSRPAFLRVLVTVAEACAPDGTLAGEPVIATVHRLPGFSRSRVGARLEARPQELPR